MSLSEENISQLKKLGRKYRVKTLSVFGSVVAGDFNSASDIDFAVDFEEEDPLKYADLYFGLKQNLENLFKRDIDLIELRGIKNQVFKKELEATQVLIYG